MAQSGNLIVIEGLDGSGKATQSAKLTQWMEQQEMPVTQVAFPDYESDSSALVRMYLEGRIGAAGKVNAYAASSFYAADRYVSFQNNWKKHYMAGHTIVADRYTTSNAAHQMSKLPREEWDGYLDWLEDYEYSRLLLPRPDQVVYLDMHPDTSRKLIRQRAGGDESKMDIHEKDLTYLISCREAALYAADRLEWRVLRCCDGENPLPVGIIFDMVLHAVFGKDL